MFPFIGMLHLNVCKAECQRYFSFYLDRIITPINTNLSPHWRKFFVFTEQLLDKGVVSKETIVLPWWGSGNPRGYSSEFSVGVCRSVPQILTQFQTKTCHFPHPFKFSDPASKIKTRVQTFVLP